MAITVAIMGRPGTGKSTSIETLSPKTTYVFNCDGKMLPFKGWKKSYNRENRNYMSTSDIPKVGELINVIANTAPHIKTIVIDTVNAMMLDDEMSRMKHKGFDKWINLASSIYEIVRNANNLRDDLVIFFMFHLESFQDDDGERVKRILTNGRKLEKIQLESKFPIVLMTKVEGTDGHNEYYFETQSNNSTAKSPKGMFDTFRIPNDLQLVVDQIHKYNE